MGGEAEVGHAGGVAQGASANSSQSMPETSPAILPFPSTPSDSSWSVNLKGSSSYALLQSPLSPGSMWHRNLKS